MPRLSRPTDVVLHIGTGKTGTSSIQSLLARNRARLAECGWLYPRSPGRTRHAELSQLVNPGDAPPGRSTGRRSAHSARRRLRRQLLAEVNGSGLFRVLLSDEALYGSPDQALHRLRRFTGPIADTLRIVVYLRRQDDHLVSRYQQVVKVGEVRRLEERTRDLDLSGTYDYHARLTAWREILQPTTFVVRRFERASFVGGSLQEDFLDATGLGVPVDALKQVPPVNESLDAESVEFLRLVNLYRTESTSETARQINNRTLVVRLTGASTGPVLSLSPEFLDRFMEQWEESNQQVAQRFLGDPTGQLFRTPRKTANTTTEQRLDPSRLDHFLELVELPEDVHAPLRRIAEREASGR